MPYVQRFAKERKYEVDVEESLTTTTEFSLHDAKNFIASLRIPESFSLRDYQVKSLAYCIRNGRAIFVSPTGSGKSLIIYWLVEYYRARAIKVLVIVDSLNLLYQLKADFCKYGRTMMRENDETIHLISAGSEKETSKPIVITTWQSAATMPKAWFQQFGLVIGDEAHRYKAKSLKKIMENLPDCRYRFGFTGSLDGIESNQMLLEGLFGPLKQITTTKKLIDEGHLAEVTIKAILLKYDKEIRKAHANDSYEDELQCLYTSKQRGHFIQKLCLSLTGNTILLFQRVGNHGVGLYDRLKAEATVPVYFVNGKVVGEEREEIRKIVNSHNGSITVASVGTFSIGVDIPRINNIVMAAPTKSVIRVLQSVGRGLRKAHDKTSCTVFDIGDDLRWNDHLNYTLRHFITRLRIYEKTQFKYKLYPVEFQ